MGFQTGRIDHDRLFVGGFGHQAGHDPGEDAHPTPAVLEALGRAVFARCITPPQPIVTDEDHAAENATIIHPRTAMALGKEGLKARHLRLGQTERIAHLS